LSKLFEEARRILREHQRELAVVLVHGEKRFAISIDQVEAVERIPRRASNRCPPRWRGRASNSSGTSASAARPTRPSCCWTRIFCFPARRRMPISSSKFQPTDPSTKPPFRVKNWTVGKRITLGFTVLLTLLLAAAESPWTAISRIYETARRC